jgi:N-acetylglucosaminyldiphosphoundecaprenol N-acetyl-beta-D-mannosaminyltransferase
LTLDVVTLEQAAQWTIASGKGAPGTCTRIAVSFNPELVMRAQSDPFVAEVLLNADLCYPDGVGAVWAAARQGVRGRADASEPDRSESTLATEALSDRPRPALGTPGRVPGIDLAGRVLELAAEQGLSVFFLGAGEGVAAEAARCQVARLPGLRVAGTHHGYFGGAAEDEIAEMVSESGTDILLAAMGAPRQEIFLYRQRERLGAGVALGVGGSFDVWAGRVRRAPGWVQSAKVEWFYRLLADPRRVRRQLVLPRFAAEVVRWSPYDYGPPRRGRVVRTPSQPARVAIAAREDGTPESRDGES